MREHFSHYYRPTEEEFEKLWHDCIFAFDANVLLDVYRLSPESRDRLLEVMEAFSDRIWIPYQVGYEFHKDRWDVIRKQETPYDKVRSTIVNAIEELKTEKLRKLNLAGRRPHPFLDIHEVHSILDKAVESVEAALAEMRQEHPDFREEDQLLEHLTELFDGKVGKPYSQEILDEKYQEAEKRYGLKIPPGYADFHDKKKPVPEPGDPDPQAYGDAILWFQLLEHVEEVKKPVIFVTRDVKEDWWLESKGQTIGPLPALIDEVRQKAGIQFYMYPTERFVELAAEFLGLESRQKAIDEIRDLRRHDEAADTYEQLEALLNAIHTQWEVKQRLSGADESLDEIEQRINELERKTAHELVTPDQAAQISQAVKAVASALSRRTGRTEYGGVYGQLYDKFNINSYKELPASRFNEALTFLTDWLEEISASDQ